MLGTKKFFTHQIRKTTIAVAAIILALSSVTASATILKDQKNLG